ncbi:siderophore ABC transporter substrate-binding protein CdtB [Saccharothrix violaceirubra]|uniref:Iron complex transport system substrate-binding protein n=1 Tax=Saccharothrix violaceirubra TaxID=413306 RepID=A0A7W7T899_9PSEU|nr:iron-siderophore ABC transporter substrate-binding protein [Saccharothrix violaceirubra]MBB4968156.1 iron complex transport system substrate-binding protein [Saccharothrix violaceirubra]
MRIAAIVAGAALLLTACGTTEDTTTPTGAAGDAPVTVTDSRGKEVRLDAPAKRVVALEWAEAEMVVSLGVTPVGVADTKGYRTWDTAAPLGDEVEDVGKRNEPSVDSIVALDPDVVVMAAGREATLAPRLEKYVPVVVTKASDASRNLDRLREDFTLVAKTLGKTAEADRILSEMDGKLDGATTALKAKAGTPFLMADGWLKGSTVDIRPFGKGSLVSDIAERLGLRNAWTGQVDARWGLGQTDVEGLTAVTDPATVLFYSASEDDVFTTGLAQNPVWQRLPFVSSGKVYKFKPGTWTFGGPRSAVAVADQIVAALAK